MTSNSLCTYFYESICSLMFRKFYYKNDICIRINTFGMKRKKEGKNKRKGKDRRKILSIYL